MDWISYNYHVYWKPNKTDGMSKNLAENMVLFRNFNKYMLFFEKEEKNKTTKWQYLEKWYKQYKSLFNLQTDF